MAKVEFNATKINVSDGEDRKNRLSRPQLGVLLYVLVSQICRLDDPQYGYLMLSAVPTNEDAEGVMETSMRRGDFCLDGVYGKTLAEQSISAAVNFPDIDLHYAQMESDGDQLQDGVYFDENLGVLALMATGGRLLLTLQLALDERGEEYAKENLLKVYAAAVLVFQHMTPKDKILQESCVTALNGIMQQYSNCMCCDGSLLDDLNWIKEAFERGCRPGIRQWKLWQEEHPEIKAYFRDK